VNFQFRLFFLLFFPLLGYTEEPSSQFPVSRILFRYTDSSADLPDIEEFDDLEVSLKGGPYIYDAADGNQNDITIALRHLRGIHSVPKLTSGALLSVANRLVRYLDEKGLMGIFVEVDPNSLDERGHDLRKPGDLNLTFLITAYRIDGVNTVGQNSYSGKKRSLNSPKHRRIAKKSPLQAGVGSDNPSLLRRDLLEEYVHFLNRHQGRNVDILLTPSSVAKRVNLDYVITEGKPWKIFTNASNSGSRKEDRWVERVGFVHNSLGESDMTLSLDYATTSFNRFHFLHGYIESPFENHVKRKWYIDAAWSRFTSSEFGIFDDEFTGMQISVTAGITSVLWQRGDLFLDLIANVKWKNIESTNKLMGIKGHTDFLIPSLGLALERIRTDSKIISHLTIETNFPDLLDTELDQLANLGRPGAEGDWWILKAMALHSRFLDPSPDNLAGQHHEVSLSAEAQYSLGYRLIPQIERSIGGSDTVRGYSQGLSSGPNALLCRGEYRYHHYFPDPQLRIVASSFFDAGRTMFERRGPGELDHTLLGTGIGIEVEWKQYVRFGAEVGIAVKGQESAAVSAGDGHGHFNITLVY
jgi:hemolysin activation/secretion protein